MLFQFGFFFNETKFEFRLKVAFYILGMCYTLVLPETQVISYLSIVLKHMLELAWVIKCLLHTNLLKLNRFCLKYETFQERRLVVARQVTMAGLSKRNLTHNRTCIKDICTETIIFVTSNAFSRSG